MDFTVLMSVYKNEKPANLSEAIKSVFNQTLLPTELLIIEDGPLTEELETVLTGAKIKYLGKVRTIALPRNVGLGLALRSGVEYSRTELIARADSDDLSLPDRFLVQVREFEKSPTLTLLSGVVGEFSEDPGEIDALRKVPLTHNEIMKFSKQRNPFNHPAVMFKKSTVLKAGNYRDFQGFEDYDLWVRILQQGNLSKNLDKMIVKMRTGEGMHKRRGGRRYLFTYRRLKKQMLQAGYISRLDYGVSLAMMTINVVMPVSLRKIVYTYFLRSER